MLAEKGPNSAARGLTTSKERSGSCGSGCVTLRPGSVLPEGTIVLLTVIRKTRQQFDRAVRAQKTCERDHRGAAEQTYERQV